MNTCSGIPQPFSFSCEMTRCNFVKLKLARNLKKRSIISVVRRVSIGMATQDRCSYVGRVLALLGYELVEGALVDGRISELR